MRLKCEDCGDAVVLRVGERRFDSRVAADFHDASRSAVRGDRDLYIVDLADVSFIDSSGIGALVGLLKSVGTSGRIELCSVAPTVSKVLKLTRLDSIFPTRDDLASALVVKAAIQPLAAG